MWIDWPAPGAAIMVATVVAVRRKYLGPCPVVPVDLGCAGWFNIVICRPWRSTQIYEESPVATAVGSVTRARPATRTGRAPVARASWATSPCTLTFPLIITGWIVPVAETGKRFPVYTSPPAPLAPNAILMR